MYPFPHGRPGSLTKKAGRNIPGSIRQTDTICRQRAMRTVRHDLPYFLRSERQTRERESGSGSPAGNDFRQDNETPLQLQPERATVIQAARRRRQ